jgi:hypothetical protein
MIELRENGVLIASNVGCNIILICYDIIKSKAERFIIDLMDRCAGGKI